MSARRLAPWVVAAVAAIVAITANSARAQQNPQAEQLFRRGQELVKQGKIAEGCDKFEASQRLESNVNTLLNLASCREKNGQLATAWALFLRAAAEARKNPQDQTLVQVAVGFSAKLEPRLPYLTVSVPDTSRVDGLTIKLDGRTLDQEEFNQGVPVDPGSHEVIGSAPGHEPWTTSITIAEAERKSVEVPRFKEIEKLAPNSDGTANGDVTQSGSATDEPSRGMTTLRKASIGAGAVGVVGLAAMTAFGLQARSTWNEAQDTNDDQLRRDAESKAGLATIGGVVGVAGVAAGVTLWIVGKPKRGDSGTAWMPIVSDREVGLAVGGRF
jgi:hypothetical protein